MVIVYDDYYWIGDGDVIVCGRVLTFEVAFRWAFDVGVGEG